MEAQINIPIYRALKLGTKNEYVNGDLFNKKYIILESELNKQIIDAIEHINEVLVSQCSTECKNEHNALKNMLYKLQSNERFEHIYEIQPSTLAIHFNDMLDSKGNKIFASLDIKGGSLIEYEEKIFEVMYLNGLIQGVANMDSIQNSLFKY